VALTASTGRPVAYAMVTARAGLMAVLLLTAFGACGGGSGTSTPVPAAPTPGPGGTPVAGPGPTIQGCPVFPPDNPWNRDVRADPVDPRSDAYIASINSGSRFLHADFGSDPTYGIPWTTVPGSQPRVPMTFDTADESDPGPYPFPPNAPVEAGGDAHVLVVDRDACRLFETYDSHLEGPGWHCGSGAVFDLRSNALRPDGWTSADAAGLPILPGLVRRDEVLLGEIRHALRFTVQRTQRAYVHPATHFASDDTNPNRPPMGLRVRLKASFDLSPFRGASRVILASLQRYGMFVADNGTDWFISGETNTAWDDDDLNQLKTVPGSAFEVVLLGPLHTN
jgi:hypothetical protein